MAKEYFEDRRLKGSINIKLTNGQTWSKDKRELCDQILMIIRNYSEKGYKLTLRQLYYQLVAAEMIRNDDKVYKKISGVLDDLRYSGNVDWDAIEDRGRVPHFPYTAKDIPSAMRDIIYSYKLKRLDDQESIIECWTEKDAISGILKGITNKYTVRLVVNKGYSSSTAMYDAYNRIIDAWTNDKGFQILYFGDHDPSGLDMIRDISERLVFMLSKGDCSHMVDEIFEEYFKQFENIENDEFFDDEVLVDMGFLKEEVYYEFDYNNDAHLDALTAAKIRYALHMTGKLKITALGLTMEQIREYNPPHNPAKISDPRAKWYVQKFGNVSWEVDALPPNIMEGIIEGGILAAIDLEKYEARMKQEREDKAAMQTFANSMNKTTEEDEDGEEEDEEEDDYSDEDED